MGSFLTFYKSYSDAVGDLNAIELPTPSYNSGMQTVSTMVNSGRNAEGNVIGTRIGRDLIKIELQWAYLTTADWKKVLQYLAKDEPNVQEGFYVFVKYFDMVTADFEIRRFYTSDRTASPFKLHPTTMAVTAWKDCSLSLVDVGSETSEVEA